MHQGFEDVAMWRAVGQTMQKDEVVDHLVDDNIFKLILFHVESEAETEFEETVAWLTCENRSYGRHTLSDCVFCVTEQYGRLWQKSGEDMRVKFVEFSVDEVECKLHVCVGN